MGRDRTEAPAALAIAVARAYPAVMGTLNQNIDTASGTETEAERQARLAREAEMIAEARDDVAAGRLVDAAEVSAWVDSLRTANKLPVLSCRR
jgi:predicted transcriptional regulator